MDRALMFSVADYIEKFVSKSKPDIGKEILIGMKLNEEALQPSSRHWMGFNSTFEIARRVLGISESQAVLLFFFYCTDNDLAYFTSRTPDELAWIQDWRSCKSNKARRALAVKVIRYYAEKWSEPEPKPNLDRDIQVQVERCAKMENALNTCFKISEAHKEDGRAVSELKQVFRDLQKDYDAITKKYKEVV